MKTTQRETMPLSADELQGVQWRLSQLEQIRQVQGKLHKNLARRELLQKRYKEAVTQGMARVQLHPEGEVVTPVEIRELLAELKEEEATWHDKLEALQESLPRLDAIAAEAQLQVWRREFEERCRRLERELEQSVTSFFDALAQLEAAKREREQLTVLQSQIRDLALAAGLQAPGLGSVPKVPRSEELIDAAGRVKAAAL